MTAGIRSLSHAYIAKDGAPSIDRVDASIFELRYFTDCMRHPSCADWCCSHGVDVDGHNVARILAHRSALERFVGSPSDEWFEELVTDPEFPSGSYRRTRVHHGACVFADRARRGCRLHAFAIEQGIDYHLLKPIVSTLFPLTFDGGLLHPSTEVHDRSLVCLDDGPTLYRGARDELHHYFGADLIFELDAIEGGTRPGTAQLRVIRS